MAHFALINEDNVVTQVIVVHNNELKDEKGVEKEEKGIKAPHFVMFVKEYLVNKYGDDVLENGGLRVTTTLDYPLQKKAEDIALKYALVNEAKVKGKNVGAKGCIRHWSIPVW